METVIILNNKLNCVDIYTDGACSGNPGPGGWGTILICNGKSKELSGGDADTTNNRMELTAVIEGLKALKRSCTVNIYTDSKYVSDAYNNKWIYKWQEHGWKKHDGTPTPNKDLWLLLMPLLSEHEVTVNWVKGHAGHPQNERCDEMAVIESHKYL